MSDHYHIHHYRTGGEEEQERKIPDRIILRRLIRYVSPHKAKLVVTGVSILTIALTGLALPYLIKIAIDEHIQAGNLYGLSIISILCLLLYVVNWIASRTRTYNISWIGENMVNTMRKQTFSNMQILSYSFYDKAETGDLISRVTNDTDTIGEVFVSEVMDALSNTITLTGVVLVMFLMNVKLALVSLTVIPLIVLSVRIFHPAFRSAYDKVQRRIAKVTSRMEENVSGIREIQSFTRETEAAKDFTKANRKDKEAHMQAAKIFGTFYPISTFISQVGRVIVLIYGGYLLIQGEITIGILVAFLAYLSRFFEPIATLTTLYNTIQSALAASERIFEIIDMVPEVKDNPKYEDMPQTCGEIVFQNVTFGYDSHTPVLKNLNFSVEPRETIAIVGPTGGGKSTIIKLLSRFYENQSGIITIDGIDIRKVKLKSLRNQIGIVLQEPHLFSGTIIENIRYGKLDASDEEVEKAAQIVGAHEFIKKLRDGYESWVGEQGVKLSAGQRQLISFARALIKNPPILVLDEATSNIDPYTELKIKEAQSILLQDRTSLIIAHRLSTVVNANRIMVINKGKIVEEGNHEDLINKQGLYRHLYQMQFRDIEGPIVSRKSASTKS